MNLQDALLYWAQIKHVANSRVDDMAAQETCRFFEEILTEDHQLRNVHIASMDDVMYLVQYEKQDETHTQRFPKELVEQLLGDINANPKYADF